MFVVYPAIFYKNIDGGYMVDFPDLGCSTEGENIEEAYIMATDCLGNWLYEFYKGDCKFPKSSNIDDIVIKDEEYTIKEGSFTSLIGIDLKEYVKKTEKRTVRKNVSIPSYLNELVKKNNINVSQILQEALKKELDM